MCTSCVYTCDQSVRYLLLDVPKHQDSSGYACYESLRTYVANIDLVGDPLQGIYRVRASELLITKCVGYPI